MWHDDLLHGLANRQRRVVFATIITIYKNIIDHPKCKNIESIKSILSKCILIQHYTFHPCFLLLNRFSITDTTEKKGYGKTLDHILVSMLKITYRVSVVISHQPILEICIYVTYHEILKMEEIMLDKIRYKSQYTHI